MSSPKLFDRRSFFAAGALWNIAHGELLKNRLSMFEILFLTLVEAQAPATLNTRSVYALDAMPELVSPQDYTVEQVRYFNKSINQSLAHVLRLPVGQFPPFLLSTEGHVMMEPGGSFIATELTPEISLTLYAGITASQITLETWLQSKADPDLQRQPPQLLYGFSLYFGLGGQLISARQQYATFGNDQLQTFVLRTLREALRLYAFTDLQENCISHEIYRLTGAAYPIPK